MDNNKTELKRSDAEIKIHIDESLSNNLKDTIKGCNEMFIVTGIGGTTGATTAPVVAQIGRMMGAMTIVVAVVPFGFEGADCKERATEAIKQLKITAHKLVIISNDELLKQATDLSPMEQIKQPCKVIADYIKKELECITIPDLPTREDYYDYILKFGIKEDIAFAISESIRKGQFASDYLHDKMQEYRKLLLQHGIPKEFINLINRITYVPSKINQAEDA